MNRRVFSRNLFLLSFAPSSRDSGKRDIQDCSTDSGRERTEGKLLRESEREKKRERMQMRVTKLYRRCQGWAMGRGGIVS